MTKEKKLDLQILAIKLWFATFGTPGMSSENDRLYMSKQLNKLLKQKSA